MVMNVTIEFHHRKWFGKIEIPSFDETGQQEHRSIDEEPKLNDEDDVEVEASLEEEEGDNALVDMHFDNSRGWHKGT